jgi:ankyrin repeat protein
MSFDLSVPKITFIFPTEEQVWEFWDVFLILLFFFWKEDEEQDLERETLESGFPFPYDNDIITPFRRACEKGDSEKVATLLKSGEHDNYHHMEVEDYVGQGTMLNRTLRWACINGDVEVVNILLNKGAYLGEFGDHYAPLYYACKHGHSDVAKVLLENGADVKYSVYYWRNGVFKTSTPLLLACKNGHADVVNVLLDNGADVNENISMECDCDICAKINICAETKFCRCNAPLYVAWMSKKKNVWKLLIERGANEDLLW